MDRASSLRLSPALGVKYGARSAPVRLPWGKAPLPHLWLLAKAPLHGVRDPDAIHSALWPQTADVVPLFYTADR